jgi:iron complex outermembrane receptor protein
LPTSGKKFVETPEWSYGMRLEWVPFDRFNFGIEGKFVDERYTTDLNDDSVPQYTLFHLDMGYDFTLGSSQTLRWQLNVYNLFDEEFFGNISSTTGAVALPGFTPSAPFLALGAPRTISTSLQMAF